MLQELVLAGIPEDNPINRAYVEGRIGRPLPPDYPWPPPYARSKKAICEECRGVILIGPELQRLHARAVRSRSPFRLLCLFDVIIKAAEYAERGESTALIKLSGKGPGQ